MKPWQKTLLTHLGIAGATAFATAGWMASHAVDLYAAWNQLNVVIAEVTKLISTVTPLILAIYGIWRSMPKPRIAEIANDPDAIKAAKEMPVTPQTVALGDALKLKV